MGPESATRTCTAPVRAGWVPLDGFAERMIFTPSLCPKGDGPDVCVITPVCDEFDAQYLLSHAYCCAQLLWQYSPIRFVREAVNTALVASTDDFITFPIAGACPVPRWTVLSKSCWARHTAVPSCQQLKSPSCLLCRSEQR